MGGSKNKSPAQKEKSQKKDSSTTKKSKKTEKGSESKTKPSVNIDESKATDYINSVKAITVQDLARQTNVKISEANSFLHKLLKNGTIERFGGFSGHHIYKSTTGN